MVTFEDPAVLDDSMNSQPEQQVEYKFDSTVRAVYHSHSDSRPLRKSARLDDQDDWGIYPIRPDHYRAPEVVLGCDWKMSTDIWNLGILICSIFLGSDLTHNQHHARSGILSKAKNCSARFTMHKAIMMLKRIWQK
ncbi:protein kinase [Histoplasma capsulatum G186AR]|uniref:Protein kinase n=1 Tax=Ajellomyces capsulatus (strain G186AR / H82 / ATCC MYA-2454 / RMSCC 2432) TaxID=447093 RepID=C0NJX5_AJECG|nr:protein kinase [Histoplasma capsulatum G186AR]XP_045288697.1 protein kinase [Histoplasma capsulatum G186AR]EEH08166.1 protein kinase [Histoplasma capsulatum G186AR]EEH08216.1 protein kinase [Histoplasma capsulatum G186AR]